MRIRNFIVALLVIVFLAIPKISYCQGVKENNKKVIDNSKSIQLFNGKNLNNWTFCLKDPNVKPSDVFSTGNGVIHVKGTPFGYMRTKKSYSDYKLHVEWRWPEEASNSGIFIHGQKPDTIWLKCFECQLKAGSAGDIICSNGSDMNERTDKSLKVVSRKAESSEKKTGEWNTMEVICLGNTIEVNINGVLQNKGTGLNLKDGSICLQSEGKDVEFRNVFLTKLSNK